MTDYVTVKDVPLVKVGTWGASTGETPIDKTDLAAILEAHQSGLLDKPVLKKGHLDPRHLNPTWDGDPAYGQADNLRISEDGMTLLGDYVNVPKELADSLPSAYPNRSVEIAWGVKLKDAAGKITKNFKAALAGVALLGRTPPAVKGLGGPQVSTMSALSAGGLECDSVTVFSTTHFSLPGGLTANQLREKLDKAVNDAFKTAPGPGSDAVEAWPWMVDYDDTTAWFRSNGGVFQVSYTADDAGVIALGDDVTEVVEKRTYVPVRDTPPVPQSMLSQTEAKDVSDANSITTERVDSTMSEYLVKLRDKLGLPATATEEEILTAAANAVPDAPAESADDATAAPKGKAGAVEAESKTEASESGKHAAPAAPADGAPETVMVSKASFAELMQDNQTTKAKLAALEAKDRASHVDGLVSQFSAAGKIHPTERDYFKGQLASNEAETVAFLSARAGIPVAEIGSENAGNAHFAAGDDFTEALAFFNVGGN